jgi:bifunctional ADP-heptose synthase (sugar kinase/adenylyltransferase)
VSLNRFEASSAAGLSHQISDDEAPEVAKLLRPQLEVDNLLITLGASGMVAATPTGVIRMPAVKVEVYDEGGAGDTVIATLALCMASSELNELCLQVAVHTAAAVVRKVGVAVPTVTDLQQITAVLG